LAKLTCPNTFRISTASEAYTYDKYLEDSPGIDFILPINYNPSYLPFIPSSISPHYWITTFEHTIPPPKHKMRLRILFFSIAILISSVNSSPFIAGSSQSPDLVSYPPTVGIRDQDIRDGLAKATPELTDTSNNLSTETIRDKFLSCLDKNDFSTDDATTAASKPKCMALGIFPATSLKLETVIDEIIELDSMHLNTKETNKMLKGSTELKRRILDIWSTILYDGYKLAKTDASPSPTFTVDKVVQNFQGYVTALRRRMLMKRGGGAFGIYFKMPEGNN
jgi:hypothetical protein